MIRLALALALALHPTPTVHRPAVIPLGSQVSMVMLGDSNVWGSQSDDGNGSRKRLADDLTADNVRWILAGAQLHGTMPDNNSEGWPGIQIVGLNARVTAVMSASPLYHAPAYVLIYAGRNDAAGGRTADQMLADMTALVDALLNAAPYVRLLVAQITPTGSSDEWNTEVGYDSLLPALAGPRVRIVNQTHLQIGPDGIHPASTDAGYGMMGDGWAQAIEAWRVV